MASGLYVSFKQLLLSAGVDLTAVDVRAVLVDSADYVVDLAAHDALDDVPAGARIAVSGALTDKAVASGVFDAADVTFSAVSGDSIEAVVLYVHTGVEATSSLVAYVDGVSVTPNGSSITLTWDNGVNKIFAL